MWMYNYMSRNIIGEPDKFQLASVVTKNSRTGITSNRRLLVIKCGKLYYYSNVPKFFNGDPKVLENSHQLPKCSIDIFNIKKINGFDSASPYFSIQFEAKHMMEKDDIRNSAMKEDYNFAARDTKQEVTWQFTCDNQFIKQRWVTALSNLKEHYKQENVEIQKFMQNLDVNSSPHPHEQLKSGASSFSSRSSIRMPLPWRDSGISRRSYNPDKGFEFKDKDSPRFQHQRIEDITFLKKNPSEATIKDHNQFQMIVKEQLHKTNSMDKRVDRDDNKFSSFAVVKVEEPKPVQQKVTLQVPQNPIIYLPPPPNPPLPITIQELPNQMSLTQTPIKQNSMSYDWQQHTDGRKSVEKTLADLKIFSDIHQNKKQQPQPLYFIPEKKVTPPPPPFLPEKKVTPPPPPPQLEYIPQKTEYPKENRFYHQDEILEKSITAEESIENIKIQSSYKTERSEKTQNYQQLYPFHWFWGEALKPEARFQDKNEYQKHLISQMLNFKERAIEGLSNWLQAKASGQARYPIIEQSNRYIVLQIGHIIMKVALLSTQKLVINGKNSIFYNEDSIKNLKRQFKISQNLFKMISKRLKAQSFLKLRIPLSVYIEYRGVSCVATRQYSQDQNNVSIQEDDWLSEKKVIIQEGYKLEWFCFRKLGKYLQVNFKTRIKNLEKDQQNYKQFLKKVVLIGRKQKHHNLVFDSPIDKTFLEISAKQNASTSIESLERYVKGLKLAKNLHGPCPKEQMITALNYSIFCKQLRKVYRSAQGQINETHFFNLIFKKQQAILSLLEQSNCQLPPKIQGQIFTFIEHYFGLMLQVDEKAFQDDYKTQKDKITSKKDIFISSSARPIIRELSLQGFQIVESYNKLNFYLQNKHPLGRAALQKKREIYRLNQNISLDQYLQLLYDEACFNYYQSDFTGCIKKCKEYQQTCPVRSTKLFSVYLLMMKAYSQFSEVDFSCILKKASDLIEYNYGEQNSSFINLYSLAAFYYERLAQKPNIFSGQKLIQISLRLIKQAQSLCLLCFGMNSKQYFDILLDVSKLYRNVNMSMTLSYFEQAKKLCQANPYLFVPQNVIMLLSYETQLNLRRSEFGQAQVSLTHALSFLDVKVSLKSKIHLYQLQYEVGFYAQKFQFCEAAIEKLWQLGTYQKLQALQMAYRTAYRQSGISESENLIDENDSVRFESYERAFVLLQQKKHKFKSLVDMLINAIENRDIYILSLTYFIINKH